MFSENTDTANEWSAGEVHLLGDIGIIMPNVEIFDNGAYGGVEPTNYASPMNGGLLFIPGALLDNTLSGDSNDIAELVQKGQINQNAYDQFIQRRLLPLFIEANGQAVKEGVAAEINIPNIGGGAFAGKFKGKMGKYTNHAIQALLTKYRDRYKISHI